MSVRRRSEVFLTWFRFRWDYVQVPESGAFDFRSIKVILFLRYQMAAGDGGTEKKKPLRVGEASAVLS